MRFLLAAFFLATALPSAAVAEDMYAISRKADGKFHASHRLYEASGKNLHEVVLCGRPYFVRPATVAWMNYEADEGRSVQLEYNVGKGWVEVCRDPAKQVTLADIGIDASDNYEVMSASDPGAHARRAVQEHQQGLCRVQEFRQDVIVLPLSLTGLR